MLAEALPAFHCAGRVSVVLGNPWARADLISLPSSQALANAESTIAQAHAERLTTPSATPAGTWRARYFRLKEHLLVAAVPENSIGPILQTLAENGLAADSIQPLWTWLTLTRPPGRKSNRNWSVLIEPGFLTIAHRTQGELDDLRTCRTDEQGPPLVDLLTRQAASSGFAAGPVETISIAATAPELAPPWQTHSLGRHVLS